MVAQKSYMAKTDEVKAEWWAVDGTDAIVGRLASDIAMILMGKHRPTYTPHALTGDFVVVTNCEKVQFTGAEHKWNTKTYARYSGFPGLKIETAAAVRERHPDRILREAVRRMLPKNKLATKMLERLKVYAGPDHPHQAQQPKLLEKVARVAAKHE